MMGVSTRNIRSLFVGLVLRHPFGVLLVAALGVAFSLLLTATRLEFHTSRLDLISAEERYRQLDQAYSQEFAELPERVIVVIRSPNPERAKAFATSLAQRWKTDLSIDQVWYRIDVEALKHKALFYLSPEDLRALRERLHQHRDLLHELAASPTLPNLFGLINRQITRSLVGHVFTGFLEEDQPEKKPVDLSLLLALLREMNGWLDGPRLPLPLGDLVHARRRGLFARRVSLVGGQPVAVRPRASQSRGWAVQPLSNGCPADSGRRPCAAARVSGRGGGGHGACRSGGG